MIVFHIAVNELKRMFQSPLAWIIMAAVQFLAALFFYLLLVQFLKPGSIAAGQGLTEVVVAGTLQITGLIMLLMTPFITMRLFSDEHRSGSIRLLLSSPVSLIELVLGKYAGVLAFVAGVLLMVALMPLSLIPGTHLDYGQLAAALLALLLLVGAFCAVGLFVSTLTNQPAVAAVGTFAVLFVLWIIHFAGHSSNQKVSAIFSYLSMLRHFDRMLGGLMNSVDVIYYLLVIAVCLLLSIWRLDSLRTYR